MPSPWSRLLAGACVLTSLGVSGGCAAGSEPIDPASSVSPATAAPEVIPADGSPLASFGYRNGPVQTFSLPRTTVLRTAVDQPNNVSAVVGQPPAPEVYAYLLRTLPAAGFTITGSDADASTLTFTGRGWTGSFTGDAQASAVLLRPA